MLSSKTPPPQPIYMQQQQPHMQQKRNTGTDSNNMFINNVYDPTKQNTTPYKTISQPTPSLTTEKSINMSSVNSIQQQPVNGVNVRVNNINRLDKMPSMNVIMVEKISEKIYNHFKSKYPTTIDASGFNKATIDAIVKQFMKKNVLDEKAISKIIEIIDYKFKTTINSNNRVGVQYDTTAFAMDVETKIPVEKYLENYTNKVSILLDSDKAIDDDLPKNMSPASDMVKITKPEPFSEDFPIRDREKQIDLMQSEIREYDFYVVINSNDRNITSYSAPNNFIIDFAPAPSPQGSDPRKGYIERNFNNIKSCELMNVIIRDTSNLTDSSDAGGVSYPYLLLEFDELQRNYYGTNDNLSKAFAILTDYTKVGNYKYYRMIGDSSENTVSRVYNPRINLNKITTKLLLPDGTLFNFGSENNNDTSNACISFGLRVITIQKNLATQFLNNA